MLPFQEKVGGTPIKRNAADAIVSRIAKKASRESPSAAPATGKRVRGKVYGLCAIEDCDQAPKSQDERHYQCTVCFISYGYTCAMNMHRCGTCNPSSKKMKTSTDTAESRAAALKKVTKFVRFVAVHARASAREAAARKMTKFVRLAVRVRAGARQAAALKVTKFVRLAVRVRAGARIVVDLTATATSSADAATASAAGTRLDVALTTTATTAATAATAATAVIATAATAGLTTITKNRQDVMSDAVSSLNSARSDGIFKEGVEVQLSDGTKCCMVQRDKSRLTAALLPVHLALTIEGRAQRVMYGDTFELSNRYVAILGTWSAARRLKT